MNDDEMIEMPEYLTVRECQKICRFKGPEPIRRAVYRGELPGVRVRANRLLIPTEAFWKWFHAKDVKPKPAHEVERPVVRTIKVPRDHRARAEEAA